MSLKETFKHLRELLANITTDLEKSENGNKAASQRVRTGTVKLEKVAKSFRKESISNEKKTKGQKKPSKTVKKTATKAKPTTNSPAATTKAKTPAATASKAKSAPVKAKPKAKATARS